MREGVETTTNILDEGGRLQVLGQEQFLESVFRFGQPKEVAEKVPDPDCVKLAVEIVAKVKPMLYVDVVSAFLAFVVEGLYSGLEGGVVLMAAPALDQGMTFVS